MHTHFLRNSLLASALVCAFAAVPVSQAFAQDSSPQSAQTMHHDAMNPGAMHADADNQTVPGKANDGWITTKIKTELATAKNVTSTDISVETKEGMVTLTGTVPSKSAKMHAVREAKSVKGVKSVNASGLTVGGM